MLNLSAAASAAASATAVSGNGGVAALSAHVLAPCQHDGRCPMDGADSWCHFVQRVERPGVTRTVKGGNPARTYQDEKFSYVVLRRGTREGLRAILRAEDEAGVEAGHERDEQRMQIAGAVGVAREHREAEEEEVGVGVEGRRGSGDAAGPGDAVQPRHRGAGAADSAAEGGTIDSDGYEEDSEGDSDGDEEEGEEGEDGVTESILPSAAALLAARGAVAGGGWGRVVRPPKKRSQHVTLQVCTAAGASLRPSA